jgi:hypothetical protein
MLHRLRLAIFAAVLTTAGYLPRDATASHNETNGTISVGQLEESFQRNERRHVRTIPAL